MAEGSYEPYENFFYQVCQTIVDTGACEAALIGERETGAMYQLYPYKEDGTPVCALRTDPYKATVTKDDGTEEEQDVYEAYNITLYCAGDNNPLNQGVRVDGIKYMSTRPLKGQKYSEPVEGGTVDVEFDGGALFRKGSRGMVIATTPTKFYIAWCDCDKPEQQVPLAAAAIAKGAVLCHQWAPTHPWLL